MCGACYAFASNTALSSYIAIREGTTPVHLSDQELVDCTSAYGNLGCRGGLEPNNWSYQKSFGATRSADYPYIAGYLSRPGVCLANGKTKVARPDTWGMMTGGASEIITRLADGPVTIGIQGENANLYNYSSGILTAATCPYQRIDHAVTVTGYVPGTGDSTTEVVTRPELWCRYRTWRDRYYRSGCQYWDEAVYSGIYCCWWEDVEETITTTGDAYFIAQNSWGTNWGEDGFFRLAVENTGSGPCGMNDEPFWVTGASI